MDKKHLEKKYEVWYWEPQQTEGGVKDITYKSEPMDLYAASTNFEERMKAMYTLGKDAIADGMITLFYVDGMNVEKAEMVARVPVDLRTRAKNIYDYFIAKDTPTAKGASDYFRNIWEALKYDMYCSTHKDTIVSIRDYSRTDKIIIQDMSINEAIDYIVENKNIEIVKVTEIWHNGTRDYIDRFMIYLDTKEVSNNEETK